MTLYLNMWRAGSNFARVTMFRSNRLIDSRLPLARRWMPPLDGAEPAMRSSRIHEVCIGPSVLFDTSIASSPERRSSRLEWRSSEDWLKPLRKS